jgi:aconitate decarboxylase
MTDKYTAELAGFAAGLRFADIPASVRGHLTSCLLDTVGCGLYGSTLPWTRILRTTVTEVEPGGASTLWGTRETGSCLQVALVNGAAVHGFELDDLHPRSIVHPGSVVLPAALAVSEYVGGISGRDLITPGVAGY